MVQCYSNADCDKLQMPIVKPKAKLFPRTCCSNGNVLYLLYLIWYSLAILWQWVLETWLVWLRNWTKELSHIGLVATAQDSTANNNAPKQNNTNKDLLVSKPRKEIRGMPKILKESQRRDKKRRKRKQQTDGVNRKQRNQSCRQLFKYEWIKHFTERQRLLG